MKIPLLANRYAAGRFLAEKLHRHAGKPNLLVLALPRGGVPVGFEIAQALNASLDVFIVRKLGVPGYEELAMGAIASGGVRVLNREVIDQLRLSQSAIEAVTRDESFELQRREKLYRGDREPEAIPGRHAILVDDGLATGSSMRAAVLALRRRQPSSITVAVPVAAVETCEQFRHEVDEIVCGHTPSPFLAVGYWYDDFSQTSDEEVCDLLDRAAHLRREREHHEPAVRH